MREPRTDLNISTTCSNRAATSKTLGTDPRVGLLLTDIQMPGMSGYELAAEVRQHWPELPIAVMSGNDVGCHGYSVVRKPFSQPQLAHATWN